MESKGHFLRNDSILIPAKIITIYIVWKIFHHFATIEGTSLNTYWLLFCEYLGSVYAFVTSKILMLIGQKAYSGGINIYLENQKEIWVQDHCLAIPAKVIFIGSILSFHGRWNEKLLFICIGLTGIVLINIARLLFVCLAWIYFPFYFFEMNHSVIYVVLCYGFIFFMIRWWINRQVERK
jgi:exosortase/archaeosortase family protein